MITESKGNLGYTAVSDLILAYGLGLSVDMWGSIPYSEAFKGIDNLKPKFDEGASVYESINTLINKSIATLESGNFGILTPDIDDLIYGGNLDNWLLFAHTLKAKQALHQIKMDPSKADEVISEAALAFTSSAYDAQINFGVSSSSASPWFQFIDQRDDIAYSGALLSSMEAIADPRYPLLIDTTGDGPFGYLGLGYLNFYYGNTDSPVHLITYAELQFMLAEAHLKNGDQTEAQAALIEGVTASMAKLGITDETVIGDYISANATLDGTDDLETVMYEKQIAMFLHPEAFTDYRRTGLPVLSPTNGNAIPSRFMYPESEYSFNGDNVPSSPSLFTPKIFWDVE